MQMYNERLDTPRWNEGFDGLWKYKCTGSDER
jgi:hypothetical protein